MSSTPEHDNTPQPLQPLDPVELDEQSREERELARILARLSPKSAAAKSAELKPTESEPTAEATLEAEVEAEEDAQAPLSPEALRAKQLSDLIDNAMAVGLVLIALVAAVAWFMQRHKDESVSVAQAGSQALTDEQLNELLKGHHCHADRLHPDTQWSTD